MLRILRQGQRWVLWFVIIVVGGVFVLYLGIGGAFTGGATGEVVVQVADRSYSVRDVERIRRSQEENYRQALGDQFDSAGLGDYLAENSARSLIRFGLMAVEAERMGLRATDAEVRQYLRGIPGFTTSGGRLDRAVITNFAEREFGSLRRFQERARDDILSRKASRLLRESVAVSDSEARDVLRFRREEIDIAYVALDPERLAEAAVIAEDQVRAMLENETERLQARYDERIEEFDLPERVRARHILIRVPNLAPEGVQELTRKRAEEVLERVRGGDDFAEVATELSQDPGTQGKGGDLGFFERGRMVKPFEDVAFALKPGEISDVVETVHGLHIIRVEEKRPAEKTPFEAAREQLAQDELRRRAGEAQAKALADELQQAVRDGSSLTDAARKAGLTLERPDPLRRRQDGRVPGLGETPELLATLFAAGKEGQSLERIFEVDGKRVLVEILARRAPPKEDIEDLVAETRENLLRERRDRAEQTWVAQRQEALRKQGKLSLNLAPLQN